MDLLIEYYERIEYDGSLKYVENIGTFSLLDSYVEFKRTEEFEKWPIDLSLAETEWSEEYGVQQKNQSNPNCNILVVNTTDNFAYFYSRVIGAGPNCY